MTNQVQGKPGTAPAPRELTITEMRQAGGGDDVIVPPTTIGGTVLVGKGG